MGGQTNASSKTGPQSADAVGMALKFSGFKTGGEIRVRLRSDVQFVVNAFGEEQVCATVRLSLVSGGNIRGQSGGVPSPVCVIRTKIPGEAVDLKECCSTPTLDQCEHTFNPRWDFECGFFVAKPSHAAVEISVWDAKGMRSRSERWELSLEFGQYINGVIPSTFLGMHFWIHLLSMLGLR